jgi:hypothetical protein
VALDKSKLAAAAASVAPPGQVQYPKPVAGRVAHIDADFMAYQVSAESKAELDPDDPTPRKTLEEMKHNAFAAVDHIRRLAAAERAVLHVTLASDKGGRDQQAMLKPYQANRADKERPTHLDSIRNHLGDGCGANSVFVGVKHSDQEADDGMAQAAYDDSENAIVCSADKDLNMVPGWKLDMTDYSISRLTDPFGWIAIKEMKSGKQLIGRGTKFFWAQCLMGDPADNISGVPEVPGWMWQQYAGTQAFKDTYDQWIKSTDEAVSKKLDDKLTLLTDKTKKCGPVLTHDILDTARNDRDCYETVLACYTRLAKEHGYEFKNYRTGAVITPSKALFSEMQLLWMRRTRDPQDVLHWLKETLRDNGTPQRGAPKYR